MTDVSASVPITIDRTAVHPPRWALLGVLFGLLSTVAIALYGPIGVSGTYPRFIGAVLRRVTPGYAAANPYLVKMGSLITTETMLVVGLLIGGFLAARIGGAKTPAAPVEMVHSRETTRTRRYVDAFLGGLLIIFGARLAGGCTSGHIISGITQLSMSGILFGAAVFGGGMLTARVIRPAIGGR